METAPYFGLSKRHAADMLGDVEHAVDSWRAVARTLGFSRDEIDSFADAFEHPERAVAQQLMA